METIRNCLGIEQAWVELAGKSSSTSTSFEVEHLSEVFLIGASFSNSLKAVSPIKKGRKGSGGNQGGAGGNGGGDGGGND